MKKITHTLLLVVACATVLLFTFGCTSAAIKKLNQAASQLPDKYHDFFEDVEPIMGKEEKQIFLGLSRDFDRDAFIEKFWASRSYDDQGFHINFKEVYYARLAMVHEAAEHPSFDFSRPWMLALKTTKGMEPERNPARIFLLNGPPDGVKRVECDEVLQPIQIWYYGYLSSIHRKDVALVFYRYFGFEYRLWLPLDGDRALFSTPSLSGFDSTMTRSDVTKLQHCADWRDVLAAMAIETNSLGEVEAMRTATQLVTPAPTSTVGVEGVRRLATDLDPNALPLEAKSMGTAFFPGETNENKTGVETSFVLDKTKLKTRDLAQDHFYNVDGTIQVIKDKQIVVGTRFRFNFSTVNVPDQLPITLSAELYPGQYTVIVLLGDANQKDPKVQSRFEDPVRVPEVGTLAKVKQSISKEEASSLPPIFVSPSLASGLLLEHVFEDALHMPVPREVTPLVAITQASKPVPASVKAPVLSPIVIIPLGQDFVLGVRHMMTRTMAAVASVEFFLDGVPYAKKMRPPFSVDIDLGPVPRRHALRAVALDAKGAEVGRDEFAMNYGAHSLRVKLISPVGEVNGKVTMQAALTIPEHTKLRDVAFYVEDKLVGTRTEEPWKKEITVPAKEMTSLRVRATLEDGTIAEDMGYVNLPGYVAGVEVNAVELYASVREGSHVVSGLTQEHFEVFEDGVPEHIETFEYAKKAPLALGLAIDVSGSMEPSLLEVLNDAVQFLDITLGTQDRGFTMAFSDAPEILVPISADKAKLKLSLAGLRAEGYTAFYDSMMRGLYELQDLKGKKALVMMTDGRDEGPYHDSSGKSRGSRYAYEDALEYASHAGVPVYVIGFKISDSELKSELSHFAERSGGRVYYASSGESLAKVFEEINRELHSQYTITYLSRSVSRRWRKVEVHMHPSSLKATTIPGYYP